MRLIKVVLITAALLVLPVECARAQSISSDSTTVTDSTVHSCGYVTRTETWGDTTFIWHMISREERAARPLRSLDSTVVHADGIYDLVHTKKYLLLEAKPVKTCPPLI